MVLKKTTTTTTILIIKIKARREKNQPLNIFFLPEFQYFACLNISIFEKKMKKYLTSSSNKKIPYLVLKIILFVCRKICINPTKQPLELKPRNKNWWHNNDKLCEYYYKQFKVYVSKRYKFFYTYVRII